MCMIAHRPTGKSGKSGANMPNEVIDTALRRHPDGFGIAYRDKEGLHVRKFGPKQAQKFRKLLKRVDKNPSIEYVAHFRMATHGMPCEELAHPFGYEDPNEGTVFVFHNGVVNLRVDKSGFESDTSVFVERCLAKLPSAWWRDSGLRAMVDLAGGWSKFVLMTEHETVNLDTHEGTWDAGIWYSSDHKPSAFTGWTGKASSRPYGMPDYEDDSDYETGWEKSADVAQREYESGKWRPESADELLLIGTPRVGEETRWTDASSVDSKVWFHGGHKLDILGDIDRTKDGDYPESILCSECFTLGDAYIIDGQAYIDLAHQFDPAEEDARP